MTYDTVISSGKHTFRNYVVFRTWPLKLGFRWWWGRAIGNRPIEGINLAEARAHQGRWSAFRCSVLAVSRRVNYRWRDRRGDCDAVTIARPVVANPEMVMFAGGLDRPPNPCTYCNKCLFQLENPLGCYEESRFASRERMIQEILSVYKAPRAARSSK